MDHETVIRVEVFGHPRPQGSKHNFVATKKGADGKRVPVLKDGKPVIIGKEMAKGLKEWRASIAQRVGEQYGGPILNGPVRVDLTFYVKRPDSHYGTGKNADRLKDSAPLFVEKSPDLDKLTRGVMDGLKNALYADDKFFWAGRIQKVWVPRDGREGVLIEARVPEFRTVGETRAARAAREAEAQGTLPLAAPGERVALPVAA
jgi:Holliday junction resolvase RusA-like endonuclease